MMVVPAMISAAGKIGTALVIVCLAVLLVRPLVSVDGRDRTVRAALGVLSTTALAVLVVVIAYRFRELA